MLTIIAINVVVFFLEGFGTNARVVDRYAMWPDGVHVQHQYYRAFTAMWLHANFTHIFFNMIALLIVGPALEVLLGKVRFLVLYLLAGLGGSVGSYLLGPPNELGIGASGAIMGVLGAYVVVGLRRRLPVAPVVGLLVLNFVIGFTGNIDWRAHLGGLVTGGVLAFLYDYAGELRDRTTALVLTVGGSVAVLAVLALLDHVRSPRVTSTSVESPPPLVDSETKIAILFHQWVRPRHDLKPWSPAPDRGRDGVVRHLGRGRPLVDPGPHRRRGAALPGPPGHRQDHGGRHRPRRRPVPGHRLPDVPAGQGGHPRRRRRDRGGPALLVPGRRHGRGRRPGGRAGGRHGRVGPPAALARAAGLPAGARARARSCPT